MNDKEKAREAAINIMLKGVIKTVYLDIRKSMKTIECAMPAWTEEIKKSEERD